MSLAREREQHKRIVKRIYLIMALIFSISLYMISVFHEHVNATIVTSITPDGDLTDWSSVTTWVSDPDEPPSCVTDQFDVEKVWIASQFPGSIGGSDYYIYFRLDRYGTQPASLSLEIPIDTNGDMIQDYFIWLDATGVGGNKMDVSYALYQGSPSTADKGNPIPNTSESYTGPSGMTYSFEARVLASKLGLPGSTGSIIILTMRTRASSSFNSEIKDCVNPTAPCTCAPEYWIIYNTGDGSATTTTATPTITVTPTETTTTATLTFTETVTTPVTVTPTITVTATTTGTEITVTPTVTATPTVTVTQTTTTFQTTMTATITYTPTVTVTPTITLTTPVTTSTTITATPTITFTATITFTPTLVTTILPITTEIITYKPPTFPVGGEIYTINKLAILALIIALTGLALVVAIAVKRRKH